MLYLVVEQLWLLLRAVVEALPLVAGGRFANYAASSLAVHPYLLHSQLACLVPGRDVRSVGRSIGRSVVIHLRKTTATLSNATSLFSRRSHELRRSESHYARSVSGILHSIWDVVNFEERELRRGRRGRICYAHTVVCSFAATLKEIPTERADEGNLPEETLSRHVPSRQTTKTTLGTRYGDNTLSNCFNRKISSCH